MTEPPSKSRQQAEIAFAEVQSQFFARDRGATDIDPISQAREGKTMRLRKARLAKELEDKATIADVSHARPVKKA